LATKHREIPNRIYRETTLKRFAHLISFRTFIIFAATPLFAQQSSAPKTQAQQKPAQQATPHQTPVAKKPTLAAAVMEHWKFVAGEFIGAADAMPEEKYNFAPTNGEFKGVRTFEEQVRHVACANFAFFKAMEKLPPPPGCEKGEPANIKTKADLMKYLGESFAYGETAIGKISSVNMLDPVEGPYAGPNTKIGMCITAIWHVTDHYGQIIEYLRMNGIVPPASR
jgi:DinB superfamily